MMAPDEIRSIADDLRKLGRDCADRAEHGDNNDWMAFHVDSWAEKLTRYADDVEAEELAR